MKSNSIYSFFENYSYLLPIGMGMLTVGVLALTLVPSEFVGGQRIMSYDKIGHVLMFGSWTFALGLYHHIIRKAPTKLWAIFLIGVIFGLSVELLQHFLPVNRHGDIFDLLADTIGCLFAIGALSKTIPKE